LDLADQREQFEAAQAQLVAQLQTATAGLNAAQSDLAANVDVTTALQQQLDESRTKIADLEVRLAQAVQLDDDSQWKMIRDLLKVYIPDEARSFSLNKSLDFPRCPLFFGCVV
jgi:chromosome segregation ATPase